jgi:hypothetical protein
MKGRCYSYKQNHTDKRFDAAAFLDLHPKRYEK